MRHLIILLLSIPSYATTTPACGSNEILLHNRTCYCPFLEFNGVCMRKRYQTSVNTTLDNLYATSRHLLSTQPLLLTVDASNEEAMQALAASLQNIRTIGTVVTRIVDSTDLLVGGDASATLEITNVTVNKNLLTITIDCRFPPIDYFYLYMHLGASTAPVCPPFDSDNRCCRGDMGAAEFITAPGVDCTADNPYPPLDRFVQMWGGTYLTDDMQTIQISIDLSSQSVPSVIEGNARVYSLGVGMVVFGKLSQNTESRVEIILNTSAIATSFGAFQYSGVEYSRLQLESCGGSVFAHLIIKATGIQSIQNLRIQTWDGGNWISPNCSNGTVMLGVNKLSGCNVSIDSQFVDIYVSMKGIVVNKTTAVYVLLQRNSILTRVVAKTDSVMLNRCNAPVIINATGHNAFMIQVMQGTQVKYSGPLQLVQLTDVAALTISIVSQSVLYNYSLENVSVVYSLVDSNRILPLMPNGEITPELAALCDAGNVCLIEDLLINGVCQTGEKCEVQNAGIFLMPLYPWGKATLKSGTYTVMVAQIKETLINNVLPQNKTGLMRRLLGWIF